MISKRETSGLTFLLTLFLLLGGATAVQAQGLGISAGANFTDMDDLQEGDVVGQFESSTGYHVGLILELGGGPFSLRPGVLYHKLGEYEFPDAEAIELTAIEVPIDLRFAFAPESPVSPYLLGGPVITFPFGDAESTEDLALTADIGGGLEFDFSGVVLMPEIRYSVGVTDFLSDDFQVGDVSVRPSDDNRRLSKVMLRLNVLF